MDHATEHSASETFPVAPQGPAKAPRPGAEPIDQPSPWSTSEKAWRFLWYIVQGTLFRWSPRTAWRWRASLLRLFGAGIGDKCKIHNTATIEIPWHLTMGRCCAIGEHAILYCLGRVTLGHDVSISQYSHVCAGTHETDTRRLLLLTPPVVIHDYVWIAADAFIGPGITIGQGAIVGARASVFKDLRPWTIYGGNPAKAIRPRDKTDWLGVLAQEQGAVP